MDSINTEKKESQVKNLVKNKILISTTKIITVNIVMLTHQRSISQPIELIINPYEINTEKKKIMVDPIMALATHKAMIFESNIMFSCPI